MGLTNAQKQARWRERRNALARDNPEVVEGALLEEAAQCEQLSDEQRAALDVEPQDVILGQAEPANGRFIIDAGVRPMPVVAVQPDRELGFSFT
jgi:hypothetical protein